MIIYFLSSHFLRIEIHMRFECEWIAFLAVFSALPHTAVILQKQEVSRMYKGCKDTNTVL